MVGQYGVPLYRVGERVFYRGQWVQIVVRKSVLSDRWVEHFYYDVLPVGVPLQTAQSFRGVPECFLSRRQL